MGDSRPLTCWSVDGVSVPSPPSLHQRRGLLRFLGAPARRIKAADDGASLSELNPDLGSLVKQRHPVLADAVKASMERAHHHSGHDGHEAEFSIEASSPFGAPDDIRIRGGASRTRSRNSYVRHSKEGALFRTPDGLRRRTLDGTSE